MKISARIEPSTGNIWEVRVELSAPRAALGDWDALAMRAALALYSALSEVQRMGDIYISRTGTLHHEGEMLVWTFSYDSVRREQFRNCAALNVAEWQTFVLTRGAIESALSAVLQARRLQLGNVFGMGGALYALKHSTPDYVAFNNKEFAAGALHENTELYAQIERALSELDWTQACARYDNGALHFAVRAGTALLSGLFKRDGEMHMAIAEGAALPVYRSDTIALHRAIEIAPCAQLP